MAGDWIKMRKDLPDDPHVVALAAALRLDVDAVLGKLFRLWVWADTHTTDGNATCVTSRWVDAHLRCDGIAGALEKVGWLNMSDNGISLPRFAEHNGETAKQRALTARRVALAKTRNVVTHEALPREEKRREDSIPPLPPPLDTDELRRLWAQWQAHRREIGRPLTPTSARRQLAVLERMGPARAAAALAHSIAGSYQNLYEPRPGAGANGAGPGVAEAFARARRRKEARER